MGINLKTLAAAKTYTKKSVDNLSSIQGQPGKDGITPHIDSVSKHWIIGDDDTGILAEGIQGEAGINGTTPHIGDNGNWWFDTIDSNIPIPSINDLLTYVDENSGISDTPIGHIISVMSNSAPCHYLICDGKEYSISDYPDLAKHFTDEFGEANYFGGNGETTFAVPDLRGEFLRGTGTATRKTGSGASVGLHQNPTKHINIGYNINDPSFWVDGAVFKNGTNTNALVDGDIYIKSNSTVGRAAKLTNWNGAAGYVQATSRPTNTSVLYCIKYESTYYVNAGNRDGLQGKDGKSAYEIAVEKGFEGDEEAWLHSLKGIQGDSPTIGENGNWFTGKIDTGIHAVIDPVEYTDEKYGIQDTPIGHIITHMGTIAPKHYLICDGTEYNIPDYPYLTKHFVDNFGRVNYFGGDGETTFAVPDLRGEFLRGTGNNNHVNNATLKNEGSGADVGIHQNATGSIPIGTSFEGNMQYISLAYKLNLWNGFSEGDSISEIYNNCFISVPSNNTNLSKRIGIFTSRPTNTSVLYCIKYEPTYFIKNTCEANHIYSTEETIVGKWIDGREIYRKIIESNIGSSTIRIDHGVENLDFFISIKGFAINNDYSAELPITDDTMSYLTKVIYKNSFNQIEIYNTNPNFADSKIYITIEYTKTSNAAN